MSNREWHKRLRDFEMVDEINLKIIPRWKESELSGDEWRQHVEIEFKFKGLSVASAGFRDMSSALMAVGRMLLDIQDNGMTDGMMKRDNETCDQPSCSNAPVVKYRLKKEFSRDGSELAESTLRIHYRKFCLKHKTRGDCGREDSDANYEKMEAA